jgi:branched-chain amino acid transport system ATP-binding protein
MAREDTGALLEIVDLQAGYGRSTVLESLSLSVGRESVVVLGRNGMGKTTFCNTLMGLVPPRSGRIIFKGTDLAGRSPEQIARAGIAYVPQGRRLFPSLTVDEHLKMLAPRKPARWTPEAVYETFPRLAQRKGNGGAELSGGEQQMLAIGRALLLNTPLILMDEPSEGLAPTIVDDLIAVIGRLVSEEGTAVLVVEQNLGAAARMAERQLIMVNGAIAAELTAEELMADPDAQRRYLGVDA